MALGLATESSPPAGPQPRTTPAAGARAALVLLLGINLFNYVDRYILASVEAPIARDFGASKTQMGWLQTAFLVTYMVTSPLFGWLGDRMSRWSLIGIGVLVWTAASGGSGLARAYLTLLALRCLVGVGEGAYGPVAPTLISDLYPVNVRGKVLAWFYAAIPVGGALGYVLGGLFVEGSRWHWAFLLTIPPGLILGVWCFFMPEPRRGLSDATGGRKANAGDYQTLVRTPSYVLNCAAQTAVNFAIGGMAFWMPRFLTEERGVSEKIASPIFGGISALAGLTATLAGGIAGDKLRPRFGGSYFLVSAGGVLAGLPVFVAMLFAPFPWAWGLVFLAVFCLFFNTGPANTALANVTHPAVRASAFALNILVIHALGDAISPPVIGWIAEHTGAHGMRTAFMFVSAPIALGGFLWLWAARYLARDTELAPRRLDDPLLPGFPVIVPAPTGEATPRP